MSSRLIQRALGPCDDAGMSTHMWEYYEIRENGRWREAKLYPHSYVNALDDEWFERAMTQFAGHPLIFN